MKQSLNMNKTTRKSEFKKNAIELRTSSVFEVGYKCDVCQVAYSVPVDSSTPESSTGGAVAASELSLEELMQQMKSM